MIVHAMVITAAVLSFQQLGVLPPAVWLLASLLPGLLALRYRSLRLPASFLLAFAGSHGWALLNEPPLLDPSLWGRDLLVTGRITGLPTSSGDARRFRLDADSLVDVDTGREQHGRWRLRVAWYRAAVPVYSGERWQLRLRLKPARSYRNPGSFDYRGWLYRQGIRYTGYVRDGEGTRRLAAAPGWSLDHWRQQLAEGIDSAPVNPTSAALLRALTLGDRSGISESQWRVFRRTGTNHLVAISGLHVGLVAGLLMWLTNAGWRRIPSLCRRLPAQQAAAWAGLAGALGYAALAGFSLPTQRALLMLLVLLGAILLRRPLRPGQGLALALIAVLLFDPAAVSSAGFWLSFLAVAAILVVIDGPPRGWSRIGQWVKLQWAVALGLAPLLLFFFQQVPWLGPLVNLFAIPFFSLLIVPLALLGILLPLPLLSDACLGLAGWLLDRGLAGLQLLADVEGVVQGLPRPSLAALALALPGIFLLMLPRGVPGRYLGLVACLPLLLVNVNRPATGGFLFTLLDVGQGTAAVVRTRDHVLVYDTGPGFRSGFNTGSAVVAPYLRQLGLDKIDLLILSHGDKDHAGGARGLLAEMSANVRLSGEPARLRGITAEPCVAGRQWRWDGVLLEILHPASGHHATGNDASCVLRVSNAAGKVLLTGDIEAASEQRLSRVLASGGVDVVTAPHHGSRSSSTAGFIATVAARDVLVSAGWRNRYGFPVPEVMARWQAAGSRVLNTADEGAISYRFAADGRLHGPVSHARRQAALW